MATEETHMKLGMIAAVVFAFSSCDKSPTVWRDELGTTDISKHRISRGVSAKGECEFSISIGRAEYVFTGIHASPQELSQCKSLKDGDEITVIRTLNMYRDGFIKDERYFAKIGKIEFALERVER